MSPCLLPTVTACLERAARRAPDRAAVVCGRRRLSYAQLTARVHEHVGRLRRLGLGPGARVGVLLPNSADYLAILFGLGGAGAVNVPLNTKLTPGELAAILAYTRLAAVVTDEEHDRRFGEVLAGLPQVLVDERGCLGGQTSLASPATLPVHGELPFQLRLTTGSTGLPKGVLLSHAQRVWVFLAMCTEFGISPRDVTLVAGPLFNGTHMVLPMLALCVGATACVLEEFDPDLVLSTIARERVSVTLMVPTMLQRLLETSRLSAVDTSSLHAILSGAAPLWTATKEALLDRFGPVLFEYYGVTEAGGMVSSLAPADQRRKVRSIGLPFVGAELQVLDDDLRLLPPGSPGRLFMRAPTVAVEYFERPEDTARAFQRGWFTAGDLAYRDDEGYYYLVGRTQDLIVTGGYKVPASEVEDVLHSHPGIREAAVFGIPDATWGELITAVVVPRQSLTADELLAFCRDRLPTFKRPRRIEFAEALPKEASGKVLKRQLRAPFWKTHEADI